MKVIFLIFGGILHVSGLIIVSSGLEAGWGGILFPLGVTFAIIGLLICVIILQMLDKRKGFWKWCCCDGC